MFSLVTLFLLGYMGWSGNVAVGGSAPRPDLPDLPGVAFGALSVSRSCTASSGLLLSGRSWDGNSLFFLGTPLFPASSGSLTGSSLGKDAFHCPLSPGERSQAAPPWEKAAFSCIWMERQVFHSEEPPGASASSNFWIFHLFPPTPPAHSCCFLKTPGPLQRVFLFLLQACLLLFLQLPSDLCSRFLCLIRGLFRDLHIISWDLSRRLEG